MLTLTDMFCGAGGSSTGAVSVPGIQVRTAMNHWARAIETHNRNHPTTDHVQADISQVDPRLVRKSDILWASPECTNHSVAKGRRRVTNQGELRFDDEPIRDLDAAADRSRATMWDVPRFAEHHRYRLIITENVVDAARWVMFDAWLMAMTSLGYEHHIVYLNSMHAQLGGLPAPQSRDRMYVMFWRKGDRRPDFDRLRPEAVCPEHGVIRAMQAWKKTERWGRYRAQYVWRCPQVSCRNHVVEPGWLPAAAAIDWSIRGERIGDRARPLAAKTMTRIEAGLRRYAGHLHLDAAGNTYDAATRGGDYWRIWPTTEPLRTLHTTAAKALIMRHNTGGAEMLTPTDEVLRTLTTMGHQSLLVPVEGRIGKDAALASEPLRTQTTRNETALLMPYYGTSQTAPVTKPIGTITTVDRYAMITLRGQNSPKPVHQVMDTVAANGNHLALADVAVPSVDDCEFRMLEPHEITAGMAFPGDYVMTGNKREQVKQAGNAVTPPAARDLVTIGAEALGVVA